MKKYFTKNSIHILAIMAVILAGIFLRTYNFHDLLRFNADQSRDAGIVRSLVNGKSSLLTLGPQAGGTNFKLGPIFYYFQYASAKIFGMFPDKIAYPDLAFSVAAIFIIYFLAKSYFGSKISLFLTLIVSLSAFAVRYAHFAWNPNSTVFFVPLFLLSLFKLGKTEGKRKMLWAIICGATLGIGFQLHTFLMVILPATVVIFFIYLFGKKNFSWKALAAIFLVAIFFNIPQLAYEAKTNGSNTKEFFRGLQTKSSSDSSTSGLPENLSQNFFCNVEANWNIVTSLGTNDDCGRSQLANGYTKEKNNSIGSVAGVIAVIFSTGGLCFLIYYLFKETDPDKKKFLFLMSIYFVLSFGIFMLFAKELSIRYFMLVFLEPIFFLGLWIKFIWEKMGNNKIFCFISIIIVLVFGALNVRAVVKTFDVESTQFENTTLGEVEFLAQFVEKNTPAGGIAYVGGKSQYLFKLFKSMQYIISTESDIEIAENDERAVFDQNSAYFYIGESENLSKNLTASYNVQGSGTFGHFTIFKLVKN
jgi:4-amino-4-deoxy-L-arabinose transferase-like glycosyltransferase